MAWSKALKFIVAFSCLLPSQYSMANTSAVSRCTSLIMSASRRLMPATSNISAQSRSQSLAIIPQVALPATTAAQISTGNWLAEQLSMPDTASSIEELMEGRNALTADELDFVLSIMRSDWFFGESMASVLSESLSPAHYNEGYGGKDYSFLKEILGIVRIKNFSSDSSERANLIASYYKKKRIVSGLVVQLLALLYTTQANANSELDLRVSRGELEGKLKDKSIDERYAYFLKLDKSILRELKDNHFKLNGRGYTTDQLQSLRQLADIIFSSESKRKFIEALFNIAFLDEAAGAFQFPGLARKSVHVVAGVLTLGQTWAFYGGFTSLEIFPPKTLQPIRTQVLKNLDLLEDSGFFNSTQSKKYTPKDLEGLTPDEVESLSRVSERRIISINDQAVKADVQWALKIKNYLDAVRKAQSENRLDSKQFGLIIQHLRELIARLKSQKSQLTNTLNSYLPEKQNIDLFYSHAKEKSNQVGSNQLNWSSLAQHLTTVEGLVALPGALLSEKIMAIDKTLSSLDLHLKAIDRARETCALSQAAQCLIDNPFQLEDFDFGPPLEIQQLPNAQSR